MKFEVTKQDEGCYVVTSPELSPETKVLVEFCYSPETQAWAWYATKAWDDEVSSHISTQKGAVKVAEKILRAYDEGGSDK